MHAKLLLLPLALTLAGCSLFGRAPVPAGLDGAARQPINSGAAVAAYRQQVLEKNAQLTRRATGTTAPAQANASAANNSPQRLERDLAESEGRVLRGASSLFMLHFDSGSTALKVPAAVASVIIPAAKSASQIALRGHTDASSISPIDKQMALGRATSARNYLVKHGVAADKIRISYQSAQHFIADNRTSAGRALNRRVEIEFAHATLAQTQPPTLLAANTPGASN
jgi:outer membrane protein OmpA-like peptidoglycan-associated protein